MSRHYDNRLRAGILIGLPLVLVLAILYALAGPSQKQEHSRLPARPLRGGPKLVAPK